MCYVCYVGRGFPDVAGNLRWLHATEQFAVTGTLTTGAANISQEGNVPDARQSQEIERQRARNIQIKETEKHDLPQLSRRRIHFESRNAERAFSRYPELRSGLVAVTSPEQ
jgi:hypothetical protein